jgi:hypothetical protein
VGINTSKAASGIRDFNLIGFPDRPIARPYRLIFGTTKPDPHIRRRHATRPRARSC